MKTLQKHTLSVFLLLSLLFCSIMPVLAYDSEEEADKTLSPYFVVISENPEVDNLPLKETSVEANIVGVIADVTVRQVYVNSGKNTLEAIYTFPLSTRAAVYGMQMTIGSRIITAKIEEKEKAREDYEKAKSEGKRASLLEQSRPNVFTMNVSNIVVGDTIVVELKYTELLVPEKGIYSFVYPTVVGPRYSNKSKKSAEVDDGFVSSPYTKSGELPASDFKFKLNINSGIPIQDVTCRTHKMSVTYPDPKRAAVCMDDSEKQGGNRDLILNYSLQGDAIESGVMLYEGEDENFFMVMVQPPKKVLKNNIPPREYVFIIDVSGSMWGFPIDVTKVLMRNLLLNLNPGDKFNLLLFSMNMGMFRTTSVDANEQNVNEALYYLDNHKAGGSTELLGALEDAYALPRTDEDMSRTFVVVTDGYVDVEREAFEMIRKNGGDTNFFSFGIGSGVNRYLIEGMAFMGNGEPMIVTKESEAKEQAEKFRSYINTPALTRIKMDYGSFQTYDVEPAAVPDMLAERPIVLFGKYKGTAKGTITLKGKVGRKAYKQSFDLSAVKPSQENAAIRYLWARERIKLLDYYVGEYDYGNDPTREKNIKTITELGLKYNLMTNYTSFIAIDEVMIEKDGELVRVEQPIPMPEGVSDYAVGFSIDEMVVSGYADGIDIADLADHKVVVTEEVVEIEEESFVYSITEQMPQFPGGEQAMHQFIMHHLTYPKEALENGIEGTVILQFVVEADGSIGEIKVLRAVDIMLDQEAIRVVKLFPKFIPGRQNGKPVAVYYTLPVRFKMQ